MNFNKLNDILNEIEKARDVLNNLWYMHTFGKNIFLNNVDCVQRFLDRAACLVLEIKGDLEFIKFCDEKCFMFDYLNKSYLMLENFWYKMNMSVAWNKSIINASRLYMFKSLDNAKKYFLENKSKILEPVL